MPATVSLIIGRACSQGGLGKTSPLAGGTTFTGIRASLSPLRLPCWPSAVTAVTPAPCRAASISAPQKVVEQAIHL